MGGASRLIRDRRKALETISNLWSSPDHVFVIHYSCESFFDRPDGTSPRITSIAIRNLATALTYSFSIHHVAERNQIAFTEIAAHYNELEKQMLTEFYDFVSGHRSDFWLHWNMRDSNYGFPAIAHRYRVLGGTPTEIADANLLDLARLIPAIYGSNYVDDPKLPSLIEQNHISKRNYLTGSEEAQAFIDGNYVNLHLSTLRKTKTLAEIVELAESGKLKTNTAWSDIYGTGLRAFVEKVTENRIVNFIAIVLTIVAGIYTIASLIF